MCFRSNCLFDGSFRSSSRLVAPTLKSFSRVRGRCCSGLRPIRHAISWLFPSCPFSGPREGLAEFISSPSLLELAVRNVPAPHKVLPACRSVCQGVAELRSRSRYRELSIRWALVFPSIPRDAAAWSQRCYLYLDTPYTPKEWQPL